MVLVPAVTPEHVVMILAGTTTFGTQGTVDFVSNADSVQQLLHEIPASNDRIKPFEALLHVKIARGVPVDSELVALHMR